MSAFRYPAVPHARRHGPRGYADAESYRPWLRDEFTFRCVYCLFREQWGRVKSAFALDHFVPVSIAPDKDRTYDNLLYACAACNAAKGSIFPATVRILQVIDNRTALIITANGSSVFVEDTRLDNAVDGQQIDLPGLFEVAERRTYTTVLGSDRTTFALRRFDAEKNLAPWLDKEFD